jgi:biotin carboxylase
MLKASWGGGGKGIRKVHSDDEVRQVFKQIQGEVRSVQRQSGEVLMGICLCCSCSAQNPSSE